ncbi:hypothetical protein POTOM_017531 [Populus tomentosa]|uniref:C3H1-type domain-containing protein n=1 Tax=Populus tomentosa TaxID=118781 RepID=A0A8X8A0D2_POPTO|nr:hypothetical protein POTOM_017531 [Populus tomentosa]
MVRTTIILVTSLSQLIDMNKNQSVYGDFSTPFDSCVGFFLMYLGNLASILLKEHVGEGIIVCTFYQKGNCTYGSRCKYEHVKTSWVASGGVAGASSSSSPHQSVILSSVPASVGSSRDGKKEDRPLCSFDVAGDCPHGDKCSFVHEEKQEIIDTYKARLRQIDCKHFNFGNGNCPFGINCFYKHTVMPGSYTWKHHKPPPRRPPPRRRSNAGHVDSSFDYFGPTMEDLLDMFDDDYLDYDNYCDPFHEEYQLDIFDYEDYFDEERLSPFDMALLLAGMDCGGASDISSDEDDFY